MKLGIFLFSFSLHIRTLIALTDPRLTGSQLREPSCLLCTALHSPSLPPKLCMIKIQDQRTKLTFLEANDWVCVHKYLRRKKIKAKTSFKDSQGVLNLKIDKDITGWAISSTDCPNSAASKI